MNHKRVRRLQREMGMRTIYPRPKFNTSVPAPENRRYPYLLRDIEIERPNQVWATDITYTAVEGKRAFVIAVIDFSAVGPGIQNHQHDGGEQLRGSAGFGHETLRKTGDFQFGSRQPVHFHGIHGGSDAGRNPDQHGRPGALSRQREDGTVLLASQIRGPQTQGLRKFECLATRSPMSE